MTPPLSVEVSDFFLIHNFEIVYNFEENLRQDIPIMMITWVPDPKRLPSISATKCNSYFRQYYFKLFHSCMYNSIMIPELTVNGNIHYHGVYQLEDPYRFYQIVLPKMKRRGYVLIDKKPVKHYNVFDFEDKKNALYYYKKDLWLYGPMFGYKYISTGDDKMNKRYRNFVKMRTLIDYFDADQAQKEADKEIEDNLRIFLNI